MASLSELIAQKEALERQIRDAQSAAKANAIAKARELMSTNGLSVADVVVPAKGKQGIRAGSKVDPKYRDPESGSTWTGRGLKPKWLTRAMQGGKTIQDFAI